MPQIKIFFEGTALRRAVVLSCRVLSIVKYWLYSVKCEARDLRFRFGTEFKVVYVRAGTTLAA